MLLSNSGAVSEWVSIKWDVLPINFRTTSTHEFNLSPIDSRIECNDAAKEWRFPIAAGETIRIESKDEYFAPVLWYADENAALHSLEAGLQSLDQAISRLSIPQKRSHTITNPSFELQTAVSRRGRLVGWTTSIDSNTRVEMDSRTASDGHASIKMEVSNAASIAWLQSDPFALTPADRLFVSFQIAAEQIPKNATLTLYQFDPKSDRFEAIAVRDFADRVQRPSPQQMWEMIGLDFSKEFQTHVLEEEPSLYRILFEAKGIGGLWLDDVSLSTSFLRETERRDLRSELFLARTSLQNGDSGPAVSMLTSPRGGLVQWGDSFITKPKVMVSLRDNSNSSAPLFVTKQKSELSIEAKTEETKTGESKIGEAKTGETKLRPIQRLRNSWWSRRD